MIKREREGTMRRALLWTIIGLLALGAAPALVRAAETAPPNPLIEAAAGETLMNPLIVQALEEGKIAPTPPAALAWKQREDQQRANQERAAAMRLLKVTGGRAQ